MTERCFAICPLHNIPCQRVVPHKAVHLRSQKRTILPPDEHFHHTDSINEPFCDWKQSFEAVEPASSKPIRGEAK
jgi:hypothetical protein